MSNLKKWDTFHCFAILGAGIIFWFTHWRILFIFSAVPSFLYLIASEWLMLKGLRPFGGYANWATFMRLVGTIVVFTFSESFDNFQIATILTILISMDGLDGFLARRFKQVTEFGANFDMETDALYVCLATILLFERNLVGSWILLIGFLRYFYVVLIYFMKMHYLVEKRTKFGPTIAVVLFIAVLIPYVLPKYIYFPFLLLASCLVIISFTWSFYLLILEKRKAEG